VLSLGWKEYKQMATQSVCLVTFENIRKKAVFNFKPLLLLGGRPTIEVTDSLGDLLSPACLETDLVFLHNNALLDPLIFQFQFKNKYPNLLI
jgi:hypothetical protein